MSMHGATSSTVLLFPILLVATADAAVSLSYVQDCCHGEVVDMKTVGTDWEPYVRWNEDDGAASGFATAVLAEVEAITGIKFVALSLLFRCSFFGIRFGRLLIAACELLHHTSQVAQPLSHY
jgi:hypothetical protein